MMRWISDAERAARAQTMGERLEEAEPPKMATAGRNVTP
jgi:hypothetical protein